MCDHASVLPYAAYLRVYQPMSAFPPRTRAYWAAYARSPDRPRRVAAVAAEHADSLRRAAASPARVAPREESTHAYVRRWEGECYICPWQTRLRSWIAFREFRTAAPAPLLSAVLPAAAARAASAELASWQGEGQSSTTQILTSRWAIPMVWFALFAPDDRCLVLDRERPADPDGASPGLPRALLYVTDMGQARRRAADAVALPRHTGNDGADIRLRRELAAARQLEEWLHQWHPRSLVELDYAGLVTLLSDAQLSADHSVAETHAALSGLAAGQPELAQAMYLRLRERWRTVRALQRAN